MKTKRIHIIRKSSIIKAIFAFIFVFAIVFVAFFYCQHEISRGAISLAESQAQMLENAIINEVFLDNIAKFEESKLFETGKNENGEIKSIQANVFEINKLKSAIYGDLNARLNNIKNSPIYVGLSNALGLRMFSNLGPQIPIMLSYDGGIVVDFVENFESSGYNQTIYSAKLLIKSQVVAMTASENITCDVETSFPLATVIIVGTTPNLVWND